MYICEYQTYVRKQDDKTFTEVGNTKKIKALHRNQIYETVHKWNVDGCLFKNNININWFFKIVMISEMSFKECDSPEVIKIPFVK